MSEIALIRRLAANSAWSTLRLHRACARLSESEFYAKRTSFFPSIPETLNHILIVDWYYLDALENGGKGRALFEDEMPFREQAAIANTQRDVDMKLVAFTNRIDEAALDARVHLERPDHVQVESARDVLMHLFAHQTHHRGQVHAMLAGTSVPPPQLDEFFLREELPLRETELRDLGLPLE